ncbi:MAG: SDR family oxidoreductase [Egibacteraceae bacterium]
MRRCAIVTGANSGIGKAIAAGLARSGYDVGITWYGDEEGVIETVEDIRKAGSRAEARHLDLSDPAIGAHVVEDLVGALGGLDVFVNNAATGRSAAFLEMSISDWQHVLDVNLTGAFVCAQAAARRMVDFGTQGRIINITSIHAYVPGSGSAAYCAAKAGLHLLTKTMALELGRYGITVNAVAPGEIATSMNGMEGVDPTTVPRPRLPLQRPGWPREVADLVIWLASEQSSYVTGASCIVDGGNMLMSAAVGA